MKAALLRIFRRPGNQVFRKSPKKDRQHNQQFSQSPLGLAEFGKMVLELSVYNGGKGVSREMKNLAMSFS